MPEFTLTPTEHTAEYTVTVTLQFTVCYIKTGVPEGKVNIRIGPGMEYRVLANITEGQKVLVLGKSGGWIWILWNEQTGYIYSDYCEE